MERGCEGWRDAEIAGPPVPGPHSRSQTVQVFLGARGIRSCRNSVLHLEANRLAIKFRSVGILVRPARERARCALAGTSGSKAYQYIRGRLASLASSSCMASFSAKDQRFVASRRCAADAR